MHLHLKLGILFLLHLDKKAGKKLVEKNILLSPKKP